MGIGIVLLGVTGIEDGIVLIYRVLEMPRSHKGPYDGETPTVLEKAADSRMLAREVSAFSKI
jgi:hypothetical protein